MTGESWSKKMISYDSWHEPTVSGANENWSVVDDFGARKPSKGETREIPEASSVRMFALWRDSNASGVVAVASVFFPVSASVVRPVVMSAGVASMVSSRSSSSARA